MLLVKDGAYGGFTVAGKSLVVVAEVQAGVLIHGRIEVQGLGPAQSVVLRGLKTGQPAEEGLLVSGCQGPVWVEDCILAGAIGDNDLVPPVGSIDAYPGALVVDSAAVSFARCDLTGGHGPGVVNEQTQSFPGDGGDGVRSEDSTVTLYDCILTGGPGGSVFDSTPDWGGNGGSGLRMLGGFAFASRTEFIGQDGGDGGADLFACGNGGEGGNGVSLSSGSPQVELLDGTFQTGTGGVGGPVCPNGGDGMPIDVFTGTATQLPGAGRKLRVATPVREQETVDLIFRGQPGDAVFALVSASQGSAWLPAFLGTLLLGNFQPVPMGTIPPTEVLIAPLTIGFLSPGVEAATVYLQMGVLDAGGAPLLGGNSAVVILDETF